MSSEYSNQKECFQRDFICQGFVSLFLNHALNGVSTPNKVEVWKLSVGNLSHSQIGISCHQLPHFQGPSVAKCGDSAESTWQDWWDLFRWCLLYPPMSLRGPSLWNVLRRHHLMDSMITEYILNTCKNKVFWEITCSILFKATGKTAQTELGT